METILSETKNGPQSEDLLPTEEIPEVKRMVNHMLYSAVTEGASDIHLENHEKEAKVRFRLDGILEDRVTPINKHNIANVISILKVDAGLDIAERRRSQDGVFKKRIGKDYIIDFRINVHATPFGEDAVIRILDRRKNLMPLDKLGFDQSTLRNYHRLIQNPQGLILFTGPTGSGKTTTLYSTLMYLNQGNKKIVTAEDPIEYTLQGISQYQVNEAIGNTFDDYARRFLRKDPDIILIGEIRDSNTSKSCVDAAMTGHLVFSTLHTNDCIGVVPRLRNLGTPAASISDSILLVVTQRLARRICVQCKEEYKPEPSLYQPYFPNGLPSGMVFTRGVGCEACRYLGYRGRVGLYEFWEVQTETRRAINRGVTEEELRDSAIENGMRPLLEDGLLKVKNGITNLEELARVISIEQIRQYAHTVRI
jgi:type IV pilus assembly protein PilB